MKSITLDLSPLHSGCLAGVTPHIWRIASSDYSNYYTGVSSAPVGNVGDAPALLDPPRRELPRDPRVPPLPRPSFGPSLPLRDGLGGRKLPEERQHVFPTSSSILPSGVPRLNRASRRSPSTIAAQRAPEGSERMASMMNLAAMPLPCSRWHRRSHRCLSQKPRQPAM